MGASISADWMKKKFPKAFGQHRMSKFQNNCSAKRFSPLRDSPQQERKTTNIFKEKTNIKYNLYR